MGPMDLVWNSVDANGIPLNPQWWHQISPGGRPNPKILCGDPGYDPGCTTQKTNVDENWWCTWDFSRWYIGGHWNWGFPVTYQGIIRWSDHSGSDDDYNFKLVPPNEAGLVVENDDGFGVEFDSDETIDHFHTPWWSSFHHAVDHSNPGWMVDGKPAIVTAVLGLDCMHGVKAELHPVWAMAIQINEYLWQMFIRNWGNEGYCSSHDHQLHISSYTIRVPWLYGASSVSIGPGTTFLTNSHKVTGPSLTINPNVEVLVTFTLPPPKEHARVNGTLDLQWAYPPGYQPPGPIFITLPGTSGNAGDMQSTSTQERKDSKEANEQKAGDVEEVVNDLLAKMTEHQRDIYFSMLPKKVISYDDIVPERDELLVLQPPAIGAEPYPQHVEKIRQRMQALRAAFGGQIPGIDPDAFKNLDQ